MVFGICRLIDILVPDVPESLELKIKRERYLAKQALADTEALLAAVSIPDPYLLHPSFCEKNDLYKCLSRKYICRL